MQAELNNNVVLPTVIPNNWKLFSCIELLNVVTVLLESINGSPGFVKILDNQVTPTKCDPFDLDILRVIRPGCNAGINTSF